MSPRQISALMTQQMKHSLNDISHNCAFQLIQRALENGINVTEVFFKMKEKYENIVTGIC